MGERQDPPIPIQIPTARDLYDETRTLFQGESVATIRQELAKAPAKGAKEAIQTLEAALATARLECIHEDVRYASLSDRNRAIAELGKHTYNVALDLGFDELREIAVDMLSEGLGSWDRAARAIEGIRIARRIKKS